MQRIPAGDRDFKKNIRYGLKAACHWHQSKSKLAGCAIASRSAFTDHDVTAKCRFSGQCISEPVRREQNLQCARVHAMAPSPSVPLPDWAQVDVDVSAHM